jgi:predicted helicase
MLLGNLAIVAKRQTKEQDFSSVWVVNTAINEGFFSIDPKGRETLFPLYWNSSDDLFKEQQKQNKKAFNIKDKMILLFNRLYGDIEANDIFYYTYGMLQTNIYRKRYIDFLKTDFPKIPLCKKNHFNFFKEKGYDLVNLHTINEKSLLENMRKKYIDNDKENEEMKIEFINTVNSKVNSGFPKYNKNRIYINSGSHFSNIAKDLWSFRVGGYQICHKIIKDRKNRDIKIKDANFIISTFHSILITMKINSLIDNYITTHGGWTEIIS